ncbi:hypothetical protein V2J09_006627 [Rumex salicifolius]
MNIALSRSELKQCRVENKIVLDLFRNLYARQQLHIHTYRLDRKDEERGAMTPKEVCEGLGLFDLKYRKWHIQRTCALKGHGLYKGLDWLSSTLKEVNFSVSPWGLSSAAKGTSIVQMRGGKAYIFVNQTFLG